jgi:hypothetical protein
MKLICKLESCDYNENCECHANSVVLDRFGKCETYDSWAKYEDGE